MEIILPNTIIKIIKIFQKNNFSCYVVGGAIRNILLSIHPKEFDLCTNAKPNQIKSLFKKYINIGEEFGCIKIFFENNWFEITTFRYEKDYKDFRHASKIKFINSPKIDALRRDFTINSIYFNGKSLIDPFNGINDLRNRLLCLIGDKNIKFKEDPLRMLRALRFKSSLDFKLEFLTLLSLKNNFHLIKHLTKFRIHEELSKIFKCNNSISSLKIFTILKGFNLILNENFKIYDFYKISKLPNKFHLKIFCILYFHSNLEKFLILDILSNNLNFNKKELTQLKLIFDILNDNKILINKVFIKNLIFKYDYELSFYILSIFDIYFYENSNILKKYFKIKWGYEPIKVKHLNITLGKILKNKKDVDKYNNYLINILHKNPNLNEKHLLMHLIKNKFKF